jgi:CubicO group peptidase (beta-lactamase class C family)
MKTSKRTIRIILLSFSLLFAVIVYVFVYRTSIIIPTQETNKEIDEIVRTIYENGQFSGAVLVSVNGDIIYNNAFGYANIEDRILNSSDTKFRIASFTKPFTAMLILQLVEEGTLQLDGKLIQYLPEFPKEKGQNITIHQLLTHTAGITGESRITDLIDIEKEFYTREELLNIIAQQELVFEPGKGREYSNFGYALLGLIIEEVTGKSYDEVLQENICKPAGMKNTLSDVTAQPIENRAVGYTYDYFTGLEKASFLDMSFVFGYGHLLSTVEDLYMFDRALYSNMLLTDESKELFFNEHGWFYERYPIGNSKKKILSNSLDGSINGFQSHTQRIERDTVFIITLRNVKESVYENEIVIKWPTFMVPRILAVLYDEPYDLPKKSAAFTVFDTLIHSGQEDAEKLYAKIMNEQLDRYYIDESEFVYFESQLTNAGMADMAKYYQRIHTEH